MLTENILLAGEESGGIGFQDYMPERDGVLSGLLLLELMAYSKKTIVQVLRSMKQKFGPFVYMRKDLKKKASKEIRVPRKILGKRVVQVKRYDGTKVILCDGSWLIVRASGTEPIVRIYAESPTENFTKKLIRFGCALI